MSDFEGPVKKESSASQHRKNNKPLMEKRRRQRINTCLTQLKTLVLEALKKDTSRYSKLEKADILEMTVKHLRTVQRQQMTAAMATDSTVVGKYRAGFSECANEVTRYLGSIDGLGSEVRTRLLGHLANCMQSVNNTPAQQNNSTSYPVPQQVQPIQVQIPASTNVNTLPGNHMQAALPNNYINPALIPGLQTLLTPSGGKFPGAVHLMPAAMPSGGVAFVVPAQFGTAQTHHGYVYTSASPMTSPISVTHATQVQCESPMDLKMCSPASRASPIQGHISPAATQSSPSVPKMDANHNIIVPANADIKSENMWRPW